MHGRLRTPLVGPLAGWELLRLARRGQSHRGRLLVVYLLLIAFIVTPVLWFEYVEPTALFVGPPRTFDAGEAARFANRFALVLLESILLAVAAMTPGYAAAAIADEKERGTLALLLTTTLSDREIVFGKAVGRLGFVLVAAAAGLPVVVGITALGGVDARLVLTGLALVGGTAALATAIGVHSACVTDEFRGAIVRAYGLTATLIGGLFIPPCLFASPFGVLALVEATRGEWIAFVLVGICYPLLQLAIAISLLAHATRRLRRGQKSLVAKLRVATRQRVITVPVERAANREGPRVPDIHERLAVLHSAVSLPPIGDADPILWKERYVTRRASVAGRRDAGQVAVIAFACLGLLLLAVGGWTLIGRLTNPSSLPDEGGRGVMTAGTMFAGVYLLPVAVSLASAVARERRRQTLDPLLALPPARRAILRIKTRAAIEQGWWWQMLAVVAVGISFGADGGWPLGLAAAGMFAAGGWFVVGLGAWLTVRSPSETRAFRFLVPAVVIVIGLPVLVWNTMDWSRTELRVLEMAAGAVIFTIGGIVLWRRAGRELELC